MWDITGKDPLSLFYLILALTLNTHSFTPLNVFCLFPFILENLGYSEKGCLISLLPIIWAQWLSEEHKGGVIRTGHFVYVPKVSAISYY